MKEKVNTKQQQLSNKYSNHVVCLYEKSHNSTKAISQSHTEVHQSFQFRLIKVLEKRCSLNQEGRNETVRSCSSSTSLLCPGDASSKKWWLRRPKHRGCHIFSPQHSDLTTEMIDLCRRELARIATVKPKAENKVIRYKDTVDNWSFVTQIQCLPVSDI